MTTFHADLGTRGTSSRPEFSQVLPRTRLFQRFDEMARRPVLWIVAPAGAGKTVAVSSYLAARSIHSLWYSLDQRDEDPAFFFLALGLATCALQAEPLPPMPLLTPEYLPSLAVFSRNFFEELYRRLPTPGALVLDNFQDAGESPALHEALRHAGLRVPPGLTLIVLSRSPPPPAFARLRAHGDLTVLDWEELRLTLDEAQALAAIRRGGTVSPALVAQYHQRTQGWTAGLVLLLEHADSGGAAAGEASEGSHGLLFDYFAGEIFDQLPATTRAILLETALLPVLTPALAAALTGQAESGEILAELHRKDFFITQRDVADSTYEFHPLFREFLIARAEKTFPADRLHALRRRAAELLTECGWPEEAANLYIENADWPALARLIQARAALLLGQGRQKTLADWLGAVPTAMLHRDGWLLYWLGLVQLSFDPAGARDTLDRAYGVFDGTDDAAGLYLSWAAIVESYVLQGADFSGLDAALDRIQCLRARHPDFPSPEVELRVYTALVILFYRVPGHPDLPAWVEQARALVESSAPVEMRLTLCAYLGYYYLWKGELEKSAWVVQVVRRLAGAPGIPALYRIFPQFVESAHAWTAGNGLGCLEAVREGLELARRSGVHIWDFRLNLVGVYGWLAQGQPDRAARLLKEALAALAPHRHLDSSLYHFVAGLTAEQQGDNDSAIAHYRRAREMAQRSGAPIPEATVIASMIGPLWQQGHVDEARECLRQARQLGEQSGSRPIHYWCDLAEARIALDQGNALTATPHLRSAMAWSRDCGGLGVVGGWGPAVMARIYAAALEADIETPYVRGLIRRNGLVPPEPEQAPEQWPWPVRIRTLGRFEVQLDDETLRSSGKAQRKPLELLTALIALGGESVPEMTLCERLWPAADGDAAHRDFSTTLYRLRRLLRNEKALPLDKGCLSLDRNLVWVDARAFESRWQRTDGNDAGLAKALLLYRGEFLPAENAAWVLEARERLRSKFRRGAERLAAQLESEERCPEAVEWYLRILEADPLAENLLYRLMRCYEHLGQRTEALAVYHRFRQLLLARLGVMPGPELQALYQRLASDGQPGPA